MAPPMDPPDVDMELDPAPQPPAPAVAAVGEGWSMLSRARGLLEEGKPSLALQAGVPSAERSRSMRGLGKGVSGKPYPRQCNARRPRLEPGTFRSQALRLYRLHQAVLLAIRSQGGEQALMQTMNRARELYAQRLQATPSVDELASLLAQCAIAEAQSTNTNPSQGPGSDPVDMLNSDEACILAESGRKQIILDAFADGSSFICLKCGGLFGTSRKDEHLTYWCGTA